MRRRKGVSGGTVLMLLFTVIVLMATFTVIYSIRRQEGDLAMDAGQLLESVNELIDISRRHLQATQTPGMSYAGAAVPMGTAAVYSPAQNTAEITPFVQTPVPAAKTPTPEPKRTFTMTFGGAIALESSVVDGAYNKETEEYAFGETLYGIMTAVHADLNIAFLESILSSQSRKGDDLLAPLQGVRSVVSGGFDGVVLGTENALAGGQEGVLETLDALKNNGIASAGLCMPDNTQKMTVLQVNGVQIALLSYTESLSKESQNAVPNKDQRNAMIQVFSKEKAVSDISLARQQGAQAVIIFMHWGGRAATAPSQEQRKTAQLLCNAGANAIIGSRSDAVQHAELISAADGSHETLVAWSLGTLLNEDRSSREVVSGVLLHAQMTHDAQTGRVLISGIEYTPTYSWRQEENGVQKYRVLISSQPAPENMIERQREQMERARTLIQTTMSKGVGIER